MSEYFDPSGLARFEATAECREARRRYKALVNQLYAPRLAKAGFVKRLWLKLLMHSDYNKLCQRNLPSDYSLWLGARGGNG